jgi:hypothetical protein
MNSLVYCRDEFARAFVNSASRIHADFSSRLLIIALSISLRSVGISRTENPGCLYFCFETFGLPICFFTIYVLHKRIDEATSRNT